MSVGNGQSRTRWRDGACYIEQEFVLRSLGLEPVEVLEQLDSRVMARTRAAGLGLARWEDGKLMLGSLCVLSLGPLVSCKLEGFAAAAQRAVLGGLAAHAGGRLGYAVRPQGGDIFLSISLLDFRPRIPLILFALTQAPVHRAAVRGAVRDLAARL
jgi:hypothetical protein